jgi:hypothetical protein
MSIYTIEFTNTEELAMQYAAYDVNDWVQNAAHNRARIAIDEIVNIAVQRYLEESQTIPGSKEEIVSAAFANGWVQSAATRSSDTSNIV